MAEAARLLRAGGLVALPTETVYGLAALALDPLAVRAIYAAKGRPLSNPLIVHVLDDAGARALVGEWPELAQRLAEAFWPGPLTLVLPRAPMVPDEVAAGGPTVALRAPSHPLMRAVLRDLTAPLAAPSANRAEHVSPTTAAHALRDLDGRIDAVLDGGACEHGIESTVVQLAESGPRLLRAGAIAAHKIEHICGRLKRGPEKGGTLASPGLHARHYAPAGVVKLGDASALRQLLPSLPEPAGVVAHSAEAAALGGEVVRLPADAAGYARGLYAALRTLEERGCASIAVEDVPAGHEWEAVRDRLQRASS